MEILKELIGLHKKEGIPFHKIFGNVKKQRGSKLLTLYNAVLKERVHTDKEAIRLLYAGEKDLQGREVRKLYSNLKKRLERKLLDAFLLPSWEHASKRSRNIRQQTVIEVSRLYAVTAMLNPMGVDKSTIVIARKGLNKSKKFGLLDMAINFCDILTRRYAYLGRKKEMLYYRALRSELETQWKVERLLGDELISLAAFFAHAQGFAEDEIEKLGKRIGAYKAMQNDSNFSFMSLYRLYQIESVYLQLIADHEKNIALSNAWIEKMKANSKSVAKGMWYGVFVNILSSWIYLGEKEKAYEAAEMLCSVYDDGRESWFIAYYIGIICRFWFRDYQEALELFLITIRHKDYKRHKYALREKWNLLLAYLYFFYKQDLLDISGMSEEEKKLLQKFRLPRFLNDMPVYSRDKRGYNTSVLIVQMLILLEQGKTDRIIDKVEALRTYASTHLRRNQAYRSNCFIRMLVKASQLNFNKQRILRDKRIKTLHQKMSAYTQKNPEVEVVPYEHQWEFLMELVSK